MSKGPTSFRLSEQAIENLQTICKHSGTNQTAAVEMALAHFAAQFKKEIEMNYIVCRPQKQLGEGEPLWSVMKIDRYDTETWPLNHEVNSRHGDDKEAAEQERDRLNAAFAPA